MELLYKSIVSDAYNHMKILVNMSFKVIAVVIVMTYTNQRNVVPRTIILPGKFTELGISLK